MKIVRNTKRSTMKTFFIILSFSIAMTACVYNEESANIKDLDTAKQENALAYSMDSSINGTKTSDSQSIPDEAFAKVSLCIQNHMPDLYLEVESIRLCNIYLSGTYYLAGEAQDAYWETDTLSTLTIETGLFKLAPNEEISFPQVGGISFIPQTTDSWIPTVLPQYSKGSYLLLNCKVYNTVTIWSDVDGNCAEVAIPLSVNFSSNQSSVIVITMAPDSRWYNIEGTTPQPVFVPITFNVTVDDWIE